MLGWLMKILIDVLHMYGWRDNERIILFCGLYLPRQLALIGHIVVAFCIKYAFNVVNDGLFRNVSSSFFHTYVTCDSSYDTVRVEIQKKYIYNKITDFEWELMGWWENMSVVCCFVLMWEFHFEKKNAPFVIEAKIDATHNSFHLKWLIDMSIKETPILETYNHVHLIGNNWDQSGISIVFNRKWVELYLLLSNANEHKGSSNGKIFSRPWHDRIKWRLENCIIIINKTHQLSDFKRKHSKCQCCIARTLNYTKNKNKTNS